MKEFINMEAHRHMETHRWNIEEYDNGIRICRGLHDKSVNCEWEYYVPPNDQLTEELAEKVTNHYCKDELLKEMAEYIHDLLTKVARYGYDFQLETEFEEGKVIMQKYREQENNQCGK